MTKAAVLYVTSALVNKEGQTKRGLKVSLSAQDRALINQ